jgi:hypothetical protein
VVNLAIAAHLGSPATAALRLRRLGQADLPAIEQHLLALDPVDRNAPFGSACSDSAVVAYAQQIDLARGILIGAVDAQMSASLVSRGAAHGRATAGGGLCPFTGRTDAAALGSGWSQRPSQPPSPKEPRWRSASSTQQPPKHLPGPDT